MSGTPFLTPPAKCQHPAWGWTTTGGMRTCGACGTRRVDDYRALALALELPAPTRLFGATARCRGTMTITPHSHPTDPTADRRADLLRRVREANRWSAERRP
ncbi:DUF6255 family natural product biosynthesis protein [Streptomyces sp. CA-181903]|uniref:DUF6255 family natural product biosynthesis protein n=1 Tax=Streptomyces sp. CA-181903 TaxID=3240055 RepID=UPI003D8AD4B9